MIEQERIFEDLQVKCYDSWLQNGSKLLVDMMAVSKGCNNLHERKDEFPGQV